MRNSLSMPTATSTTDATELLFSRVYAAPRELVFDAWTNPKHLARWWGPDGFATITKRMELRVGGVWEYLMRDQAGTEFPCQAVFRVIDRPFELAFSHVGGRKEDPHLTCEFRIHFEQVGETTQLKMCMTFSNNQALVHAKKQGVEQGGLETLSRLADFVFSTPQQNTGRDSPQGHSG